MIVSSILMKRPDIGFEIASFVVFFNFIGQIYNPLLDAADILSDILSTQASVEKIMSLLNTKPEIQDSKEVIEKYGDIFNAKNCEEKTKVRLNLKTSAFLILKE